MWKAREISSCTHGGTLLRTGMSALRHGRGGERHSVNAVKFPFEPAAEGRRFQRVNDWDMMPVLLLLLFGLALSISVGIIVVAVRRARVRGKGPGAESASAAIPASAFARSAI